MNPGCQLREGGQRGIPPVTSMPGAEQKHYAMSLLQKVPSPAVGGRSCACFGEVQPAALGLLGNERGGAERLLIGLGKCYPFPAHHRQVNFERCIPVRRTEAHRNFCFPLMSLGVGVRAKAPHSCFFHCNP